MPSVTTAKANTILFWWTATIVADRLVLGRVLPAIESDTGERIATVPQSLAAIPEVYRAYYPAVYFPVTYGDLSVYAQTRGQELARQNIQQRGVLVAKARIDAANTHLLNWNQTAKQRVRFLRKVRGYALLPSPKEMTALSIDCSPLFGEEPPTRYRGSAIDTTNGRDEGGTGGKAKARGRGARAGGRRSPVLAAAAHWEELRAKDKPIPLDIYPPHQPVQTVHRPLPPLATQPLPSHRVEYGVSDDEMREFVDAQPDDQLLDRVPGMAKDIDVPATFGMPMCCPSTEEL